jgi:hypothetical protein
MKARRRGTAYVIVLGLASLVGVMAIGTLGLTRARGRAGAESMDAAAARQCALDGVEIAKLWIRQDVNWRINRTAGAWATDLATSSGTVTIEVADLVDGNMAKGQHDSLFVKCTGKKGTAKHIFSVTLRADPIPLSCLAYVAHTGGEIRVLSGKTLNAPGGIVSANDRLRNEGTITGGIDVNEANPLGTVTGTPINTNQPDKDPPSDSIINKYEALGTLLTGVPNSIQNEILAPGYNPFGGGTNADGIYVLRPTGNQTIKTSRIHGTLVVILNSGMKLFVDDRVLFHPSRTDQPTLIVKGNAEFGYYSGGEVLSETLTLRNFNPPGAPYNGVSDILPLNTYPSEIQGLVHVTGIATLKQTARIRGALMVAGTGNEVLRVEDTPELIYTPSLFTSPPQWYTKEVRMPVQIGTWSQPAN